MACELEEQQYKWYIVQVLSGCEEKVCNFILKLELNCYFKKVFVPYEEVVALRRGKEVVVKKKIFPGYVFVCMNLCDQSLELVKKIKGVSTFLGKSNPKVIDDDKIDSILNELNKNKFNDQSKQKYGIGERIKVKDGPFQHFDGNIHSINEEKGSVKIVVSIFNRPTELELDLNQIEKEIKE